MINSPLIPFTSAEITAIKAWIADGGGLLLSGEAGWTTENTNINLLLNDFDLELNTTAGTYGSITTTDSTQHPITEGVSTLFFSGGNYVNISGSAEAVWYNGPDIIVGAQDYGNGRVVLFGDINHQGSAISSSDNEQFGINLANWLTSGKSDILLYVGYGGKVNFYRTSVALALNDLVLDYYLTADLDFFNLSLNSQTWDMVIVDAPWDSLSSALCEEVAQYVDSSGKLLMSYYWVNNIPDHRLWPLLGFNYSAQMPDSVPIYLWDESHDIFNIPFDYDAGNFTPTTDEGDEGDLLNVFENATALAGLTSTVANDESIIVLRNDGKTLYNGYLIDQFQGDYDDSTYEDAFELWENEIAYLYFDKPTVNHPDDITFEGGASGNNWTWTPTSPMPNRYNIKQDSVTLDSGTWDGSTIFISVDDFYPGYYEVKLTVWDDFGYSTIDIVTVNVTDSIAPIISNPGDIEYEIGEIGNYINWTGSDVFPDFYRIYIDDVPRLAHSWDGSNIIFNLDGFAAGTYVVKLVLYDTIGQTISDSVNVTVTPLETTTTETTTSTTTTNTTPTNATTPDDLSIVMIVVVIGVAAGIAGLIIVILYMKKKKS